MNRQCKCVDCGYEFDYDDRSVVKESHGFNDGFYETFSCCPNCGGDFEDAVECHECGDAFTENEIYGDKWCEKCLRETINYDTFFEYCEANKDENYLDTFVMCYLLNCDEVPKYPSWDFHQLMIDVYKARVDDIKSAMTASYKAVIDILPACIRFIMDDDGSIGRENYADWLNKREVKQMAKMEIPITINLPDDWLDKVVERIKKDGDLVLVTRCENCEYYTEKENKSYCGHFCERMTEFVQPEDFCSYAKPKEMEVK